MPTNDDDTEPANISRAHSRPEPGSQTMVQARARVYGLLAAVFDGETARLATALDEEAFVELATVLPLDIETADLETADLDERALKIGYDNLFVVPGTHYVPPFGSAHATDPSEEFDSDSPYHTAGEAGELLGDPATDIVQLYDAAGFEPERGDDIPDHLAAAFEFMRALCEREAAVIGGPDPDTGSLDAVRGLQASTLAQLSWLDQFEEAVAAEDTAEGVYATVARIARIFTAWDAREGVQTHQPPSDLSLGDQETTD